MFTASVLKGIHDPELREELHLDDTGPDTESALNWIWDGIQNFKPMVGEEEEKPKPLAPTELLREFYLSIARRGLQKTYEDANKLKPDQVPKQNGLVIIVGAGMAGLVAGYELKRAGYEVNILEMSERYGGRVKTLGEKDGFDKGLWADAGAMRLPLIAKEDRPISESLHYLTDYYAGKDKFKLKSIPFNNHSGNAVYNFYGEITKIKDWKDSQFTEYWPGWDAKVKDLIPKVKNIDDYYYRTIDIVTNLLRNRMDNILTNQIKERAKEWDIWIKNWSQFSFGAFIRSTATGILSQLDPHYLTDDEVCQVKKLDQYLPWPDAAITAYTVVDYYLALDVSLGKWLIEEMAQWFSLNMHTLEGGLSALPNAFATQGNMEEDITYNRCVTKVEYVWTSDKEKLVKVSGVITSSGQKFCVTGRSVILTPALHVIRGIQVVNGIKIPDGIDPKSIVHDSILKPFPKDYQKAIQNIGYTPSTKIMLQYKKQFWNTGKDPETDILAGCSRTNLPIGQLYYPTEVLMHPAKTSKYEGTDGDKPNGEEIDGIWIEPAPVTDDQKGILMVYTWKTEALLWGALTKDMAIRLAVDQVDELHPELNTKELFEVGSVEAWASDPTTLGGFAILRPREYVSVLYLMQHPWRNIYFAGEGVSFAAGWIQGALGSGLRAAYQLFADDHKPVKPVKVCV